LPKLDAALGDVAVERGAHFGVLDLQIGQRQVGLHLAQARLGAARLGVLDRDLVDLTFGERDRGARLDDALAGLVDRVHTVAELGLRLLDLTLGLRHAAL